MIVRCRGCPTTALTLLDAGDLTGVTSDARARSGADLLAACRACGLIQKPDTRGWDRAAEAIYREYDLYHQSGGAEQRLFSDGGSVPRSEQILDHVMDVYPFPERGRLLDYGCGTGAMLSAAGRLLPGWSLDGYDLDDRHADRVRDLPGVEQFYFGGLHRPDDHYDLIVLSHVLEHVRLPWSLLGRLAAQLRPGGALLVQVPDARANPFDLMVADHASHFTAFALGALARRAMLRADIFARVVPKELTAVLAPGNALHWTPPDEDGAAIAASHLDWLRAVAQDAREQEIDAVFGSSIAATWLAACLPPVACFVDEDPNRIGRLHNGVPILSPSTLEDGRRVYVPCAPSQADALIRRLTERYPGVRWIAPPDEAAS